MFTFPVAGPQARAVPVNKAKKTHFKRCSRLVGDARLLTLGSLIFSKNLILFEF